MPGPKKVVKLADIVPTKVLVGIDTEREIEVRGLTLVEMIKLLRTHSKVFLEMFAAGLDELKGESLAPFLVKAPEMVAEVIALACDTTDDASLANAQALPGTVQLIALFEIWKLSVPDPKKLQELLSQVTAQLQSAKGQLNGLANRLKTNSATASSSPSNSLPATDTV